MKFASLSRLLLLLFAIAATARATDSNPFTLDLIMSDPDWIGQAPEQPFVSADGKSAYYQRKEKGSDLRSLWRAGSQGDEKNQLQWISVPT